MRKEIGKSANCGEFSRRSFLKGGAVAFGAAALASGSLVGCQPQSASEKEVLSSTGAAGAYEVIDADILVIGGGNLGVHIAYAAMEEGHTVTLLDKGPYRHSGVSGMSWDYFAGCFFNPAISYLGIENGEALNNAIAYNKERNRFVYQVNHGQTLPDRGEDGRYLPYLADIRTQGQFVRRQADNASQADRMFIDDQFMVTNLLVSEGVCQGVMGIYLPTGAFRVYRANATVVATGGCCWIYGWLTVGAYTINNPDNTADVEMAAFRCGAGIANSEFACYDLMTINPAGLGCAFGAGLGADAQEFEWIFDNEGKNLFSPDDENVSDRNYFNQYVAKAIAVDGRGTEDNGVFLNVGETPLRYGNERNIKLLEKFGINVRSEQVKIAPEMFEHGGSPVVDGQMMTEIEGLFCGRNYPGGADVSGNYFYGPYTGHCAALYAEKHEGGSIDWSAVDAEYERLTQMVSTDREDGIRPLEIRKKIQAAGFKGLGVYRTTELMEEALAELEDIRANDMPKMVVADKGTAFNTDWRHAIENWNLLDLAEMSVRASINREETRGSYMRAEFPEKNDEDWACVQVCRSKGNGMVFDKVVFESLDASLLD